MGQHQWDALLRVIGKKELIGDERFKDPSTRYKHRELVDKLIEDWTSTKTAYEAFHALSQAGVPAGITLNTAQIMNDPHFIERGSVVELEHPVRGKFKTLSCVPRLSASPVEVTCAPLLGEHNQEIYGQFMGYTQDDLEQLRQGGII